MASKQEIASYLQELNIVTGNDVLDKCLELCLKYNIGAEDFCDQWYAFTASHLNGAAPTIDHLEKLERKEFKSKDRSFSRHISSTPKQTSVVVQDLDANNLIGSYSSTTPKSSRLQKPQTSVQSITPKTPVAKDLSQSYSEYGSSSVSVSDKYTQRSDSRSVQCYYGPLTASYKRISEFPVTIKKINELSPDVRYMYEIMGKKARSLNDMTQYLGHAILDKYGLTLTEGLLKTQLGEMTTYGRLASDSDGKINVQSVLLEGTLETNLNCTTILNLNKLTKYSLFPGQVAVLQGNNVNSTNFIAEKIFTEAVLNLPIEPPVTNDPMQIVIAAGPFTLQGNLSYEPLHDLLKYVNEYKPHVLILMGPFIERAHASIRDGGLAQTCDSFFEGLIENIMNSLIGAEVQVVVVSSQKDAHHHPVYPTPPYKIRENYHNLTFVSDPCMININGLIIGATTVDVLFHISQFELYLDKNPKAVADRMGRLASHLINQQSFYPLYPPHSETCIDHELLEQYGTMECKPHILVLPSNLRNFVKNIQDCLVVNPERLIKGNVAGTYARIEISPGSSTSICNRSACQILRV